MKKLPFILFFFLFSCLSLMAQDVTDSIGDSGIPKAFIGINAGSGYFYAPHYSSTVGCAGFDVSFRVKDSLAIGFYVTYRSMNNLNLGLLFLIGNLNKNSFLLGFGPNFEPLMELVAKKNLSPIFVCESAGTQDRDALAMKRYYETVGSN